MLGVLASSLSTAPRPHIINIIADDLGWYDTAVYNPDSPSPNLLALSNEGIRLDHHYVFRYCSPTRRSFLSGRFPNHITTVQPDGNNLCSDFLPLNFTLLSEKLAKGGYENHFIGKGHLGYETMDHLPINRGFKSHVGYLAGSEGYAYGSGSSDPHNGTHDMWHDDAPGCDIVPEIDYSANFYASRAMKIINAHKSGDPPLFMYLAIQNVHSPYTLPPAWETEEYPKLWDKTYGNMIHMLDQAVINVTNALKTSGLWENTLVTFFADNGGIGRGNNYPLRGHKHDPWEGGTRATAFVTGGFIPEHLRGTSTGAKLIHVADWYPTYCNLAGVDPSGVASGKAREIDGVDVWPLIIGANTTQSRALTPTTETSIIDVSNGTRWWKLITLAGLSQYYTKNQTTLKPTDPCLEKKQIDPPQPGRTDPIVNGCPVCNATMPCLYDLLADPSERNNVAAQHPDIVSRLTPPLEQSQKSYVTGRIDTALLVEKYEAINKNSWGGYLGPCYKRKNTSIV